MIAPSSNDLIFTSAAEEQMWINRSKGLFEAKDITALVLEVCYRHLVSPSKIDNTVLRASFYKFIKTNDIHVHHRNKQRSDNDPSNLQLCTPEVHSRIHHLQDEEEVAKLVSLPSVAELPSGISNPTTLISVLTKHVLDCVNWEPSYDMQIQALQFFCKLTNLANSQTRTKKLSVGELVWEVFPDYVECTCWVHPKVELYLEFDRLSDGGQLRQTDDDMYLLLQSLKENIKSGVLSATDIFAESCGGFDMQATKVEDKKLNRLVQVAAQHIEEQTGSPCTFDPESGSISCVDAAGNEVKLFVGVEMIPSYRVYATDGTPLMVFDTPVDLAETVEGMLMGDQLTTL